MNNKNKIQKAKQLKPTTINFIDDDDEEKSRENKIKKSTIIEKLEFLKLCAEKQSKQLKHHRLEQENLISILTSKNEELSNFVTKLEKT